MEFTFNGSMSETIDFDPANDTLNLNVAPNQFANISNDMDDDGTERVRFETMSGAILTLTGVSLDDLTNDNVLIQGDGIFTVGDAQDGDDDDAIEGTTFSDIIFGLTTNDIDAGDGDNLIFGGSGRADPDDDSDEIVSGDGDDLIFANGGDDIVNSGSGNDTVYGGKGEDQITAAPEAGERAMLFGGGGEVDINEDTDIITVGQVDDIADGAADVFGNAGDDDINVYANGDNRVEGGRDDDNILVNGDGDNVVRGGRGSDTITVEGDGNNTVFGGNESGSPDDDADTIIVNGEGNNTVYGNGGGDTITVNGADREGANQGENGEGNNLLFGGMGDDIISLSQSNGTNVIYGGVGGDSISASVIDGGSTTIFGGSSESDKSDDGDILGIGATGGNHSIFGNAGDDFITVNAEDANVDAFGGQDDDTFSATVEGDAVVNLEGNLGDDTFTVQTLTEDATLTMTGGEGDDTFNVGSGGILGEISGSATIFGNQGEDIININNVNEGASLEVFGGQDDDQITVSSVEADATVDVDAGDGDDVVNIGNVFATEGVSGEINVDLGDGDDELTANFGTDATATVFGGNGEDDINLANSAADLTVYGGTGRVDAAADDDEIFTGSGDDVLYGNGGDDVLSAGAGDDQLFGGQGDDRLIGGEGSDTLNGGLGEDTAVFSGDFDPTRVTFNIDENGNILSFATVTTQNGETLDVDTLVGIEALEFDNGTFSLQDFIDDYGVKVASADGTTATAFQTVQAGIDFAQSTAATGDRVFVGAGEYDEMVTVSEANLQLIGANASVAGSGERGAESTLTSVRFSAGATGGSMAGFTVNGANPNDETAAVTVLASGVSVTNNVLTADDIDGSRGLVAGGGADGLTVSDNLIAGYDVYGIYLNATGAGDSIVSGNVLTGNNESENAAGAGVVIEQNTVESFNGNAFSESGVIDLRFSLRTSGDYDLSDLVENNTFSGGTVDEVRIIYSEDSEITGTDGNDRFQSGVGVGSYEDAGDGVTINAGDGDDIILGSAEIDTLNGEDGADVFGGNLDGDTVDFGSDSDADEAHFTTNAGADGAATIENFDVGNDFIALLDGDSDGAVDFDASDSTAGSAGTKFTSDDVGSSYFEFNFEDGSFGSSDDSSESDLDDADNAVVVLNDFDRADGDSTSDDNLGLGGIENSYVVVQNGDNAEVYFFGDDTDTDGSDNGFDDADATLVATVTDVDVNDLNFDNFGVYGTDEGGLSA